MEENAKFQIGDKVRILVDTVPIGLDKRPYRVPKGEVRVVVQYARSAYDHALVYMLTKGPFRDVAGIGFREDEIELVN